MGDEGAAALFTACCQCAERGHLIDIQGVFTTTQKDNIISTYDAAKKLMRAEQKEAESEPPQKGQGFLNQKGSSEAVSNREEAEAEAQAQAQAEAQAGSVEPEPAAPEAVQEKGSKLKKRMSQVLGVLGVVLSVTSFLGLLTQWGVLQGPLLSAGVQGLIGLMGANMLVPSLSVVLGLGIVSLLVMSLSHRMHKRGSAMSGVGLSETQASPRPSTTQESLSSNPHPPVPGAGRDQSKRAAGPGASPRQ